MLAAYHQLRLELATELNRILDYWSNHTLDLDYEGFVGSIDHFNKVLPKANKGVILNTRILWSFSAASNRLDGNTYKTICERAYSYLKKYFKDETYNGVYWELDYKGNPINKRKQVYAQSFAIYALSEFYSFTKNEEAKNWAVTIFEELEKYAKDPIKLGYLEAFNEDWSPIKDMRLSNKDMNAAKTMNTHLHILEAYTALLKICNSEVLRQALKELIVLFLEKFLNQENHYELFFDENWKLLSDSVSYGHDIETAWLIIEAAKLVGDKSLLKRTKEVAIKVADAFLEEGIDHDGAVINEKNRATGQIDSDRHWWPQVEALIGLNYAYELKKDQKYLEHALRIWEFTKKHLLDYKHGEWHYRVDKEGKVYAEEDKVSMWKAPYHTSRACIKLGYYANDMRLQ